VSHAVISGTVGLLPTALLSNPTPTAEENFGNSQKRNKTLGGVPKGTLKSRPQGWRRQPGFTLGDQSPRILGLKPLGIPKGANRNFIGKSLFQRGLLNATVRYTTTPYPPFWVLRPKSFSISPGGWSNCRWNVFFCLFSLSLRALKMHGYSGQMRRFNIAWDGWWAGALLRKLQHKHHRRYG
jgi:hypothetical protein